VAGLELATALGRMSGMRTLYTRTARDFSQLLDSVVAELGAALASGDTQLAQMRLHTLKGNAATLGAMPLSQAAAALERLLRATRHAPAYADQLDALQQLAQATQQQLAQAVRLLETATPADPSAPTRAVDVPALLADLTALAALLAQSDLQSLDRFAQLRQALEQLAATGSEALETAMQDLDFARAHALCTQLLEQWGAPLVSEPGA
jgi:two-component system sensor histidine kinase/response regulator